MRKFIFVFLVICGLWDLQRIPGHAAEVANFHTVNGVITEIDGGIVYWSDGDDIYYFYGVGYNPGETITNVMDQNNIHVFIGVTNV